MAEGRWSDDRFLDALRRQGDDLADQTVARLEAEHGVAEVRHLFKRMRSNSAAFPAELPPVLAAFFEQTGELPPGADLERLERGGRVFMTHAFPGAVVLLAASLPSGYSAPCLSRILTISGDLEHHPYRRLLGVLELVLNVGSARGFEAQGSAVILAQKMRLLHAGIRTIVPRYRPSYTDDYGVPVNHEDMLGTVMGFSLLVIDGLRKLEVGLSEDDAEDLYYVWRIFAQMVGIHPPQDPANPELVPASMSSAARFYDAYRRRHFRPAAQNPDGVALAQANLAMMRDMIPRWLRALGFGLAPRICMQDLLGVEGMERVGISPVLGHAVNKTLLSLGIRFVQRRLDGLPGGLSAHLAQVIFQGMIDREWGGEVTFLIPDSLAGMRQLA